MRSLSGEYRRCTINLHNKWTRSNFYCIFLNDLYGIGMLIHLPQSESALDAEVFSDCSVRGFIRSRCSLIIFRGDQMLTYLFIPTFFYRQKNLRPNQVLIATLFIGIIVLSGCNARDHATASHPVTVDLPASGDVVANFVRQANTKDEAQVLLADGRTATLRMVRQYFAASGRDCREVLMRTGSAQNLRLACKADDGTWVSTPSLLGGG